MCEISSQDEDERSLATFKSWQNTNFSCLDSDRYHSQKYSDRWVRRSDSKNRRVLSDISAGLFSQSTGDTRNS